MTTTTTAKSTPSAWCMYIGKKDAAKANFDTARSNKVWGAVEKDTLEGIKKGDLVLFVHALIQPSNAPAGFPRSDYSQFIDKADKATIVLWARVTSDIYYSEVAIWKDKVYPYRFSISIEREEANYSLKKGFPVTFLDVVYDSLTKKRPIKFPHSIIEYPISISNKVNAGSKAVREAPDGQSEIDFAQEAIDNLAGKQRGYTQQGFSSTPEYRKAIELEAMRQAKLYYSEQGWNVDDVSTSQSYDLCCRKPGRELHVEVKGTTSTGKQILLTANEVKHAKQNYPNTALFVVAFIAVIQEGTEIKASGGKVRVIEPWLPSDAALTPLAFSYIVPD